MLCQDKILKENWPFQRGDLYLIDYERGQRPRESSIEISILLFPKEQNETTKHYMVAPITLDLTGLDPKSDVVIRDKKDIGKPYAATLMRSHPVEQYRLLAYVGKISDKSADRIVRRYQEVMADFCDMPIK